MPLITVGAGAAAIPPGTYAATLTGITPKRLTTQFSNPPGSEQDFLEWAWLVETKDRDIELRSLTSTATGPKSRIFEYLVALLGGDKVVVDAGFDEADLVGKRVMVSTVTDDGGWAKIDRVVAAPAVVNRSRADLEAPVASAPAAQSPTEDDLPF